MSKIKDLILLITVASVALSGISCSTQRKLNTIQKGNIAAQLLLDKNSDKIPELEYRKLTRDTLKVQNDDGTEMLIMKAIKDEETGEMVASDVIDAAVVTARFRNIAERNGKVDLAFQVIVPASMQDSKWQLRFFPDMFVLGDSIRLDSVIITGHEYRKSQLKGYQHYEKFLSRIVSDTTKFIDLHQLEVFLKRNIPQLYSFKTDSTEVSEDDFLSCYGVSEKEAVEHYTNQIAKNRNNRRKGRMDKMYRKYIKTPIVTDGVRLEEVIESPYGDFVYNYVQTINTRPKLRKVDILLSGAIYEQDKKIFTIPTSEPLTFYISSISAFTDNTERYLTKVIERQAEANTEFRIDFESGKSEIKPDLAENAQSIDFIKNTLNSLVRNETFDLDSIIVSATASPEGNYSSNATLAQQRSESVSEFFKAYLTNYRDSIDSSAGLSFNLDETYQIEKKPAEIIFTPRCIPENWVGLSEIVRKDTLLTEKDKDEIYKICETEDPDIRENLLRKKTYYSHLRENIYPKLRTVRFNFYLHRKGMVKETVHTTVLDSVYVSGVQALKNMDYELAIKLLKPYKDYNTAIAYTALGRNNNALSILTKLEKTAEVNYMLAIIYSRTGNSEKAVECYLKSCKQNPSFVHRGNLDPEISVLIKLYGLNSQSEEEFQYDL